MGRLVKFISDNWLLILICLTVLILRIFKIEELFYFTYDEAIPAFVGRRLILWQHIPLIGGVTPFNFHLGPYFYWFYAILLAIGKLNPVIWGYAGAVIAVLTTLFIYKLGSDIGSKKLAITAAVFWTFSYLANIYDRHLWALYWGPLFSVIILISLIKIVKGNEKFVYLLGIVLALSIHADPSNLVFLLLSIIVWFIYRLEIKRSTVIACCMILFSFIPLFVFDLRHNFSNTRPAVDFWKQGRNNPGFDFDKFSQNSLLFPRTFTRLIYTFGDNEVAKQYSYCSSFVKEKFNAIPNYLIILSSLIIIFFILLNIKKTKDNTGWHLIALLTALYFAGIQIYGTIFRADIFEHYITGIFPAFFLIAAFFISKLPRILWLFAIGVFVIFNLYELSFAENTQGLAVKRQAIEYTMAQVGDRPFSLDSLSTCWKLNGYRYLFAVFGREPIKSYVDPNFSYLYGTTFVSEKHPETVTAFVVHDFMLETAEFYARYAILKSHEVKSAVFGNIEVIIMGNSSNWFDQP